MRAGALARHRFTWQRPDTTAVGGYTTVETRPGGLRFASGSESIRFGTVTAVVNHVIEMRYWNQIRADWRAVDADSGRTFQVASYGDPTDRRRELHVFCGEIQ